MFLDENFMLQSPLAQKIYTESVKDLPIIDYHCHINPKEIAEDKRYQNITEIWLSCGDHYKWRAIRSAGYGEDYVTGDKSDREKFGAWAAALEGCIGNPLYIWAHMELKKYFGISTPLSSETAEKIWHECNERLISDPAMSARGIMRSSNVKLICTTDDPADSLEYHKKIAESGFEIAVLPAFRPDKGLHIEKSGWAEYIAKLGLSAGIEIKDKNSLFDAYKKRLAFFAQNGCKTADNGFEDIPFARETSSVTLDSVLKKALAGAALSQEETDIYKTELMLFLGGEYKKLGFVMQIHFGVSRNNSSRLFKSYGPDAGGDAIGGFACIGRLTRLMDALDSRGLLPRTVLYSINPSDNTALDALIGCFQADKDSEVSVQKIQHGSAWWFNDNNTGMRTQIKELANNSRLAGFIGMLTDSRSFLSYTRHDYFRRILCDVIADYAVTGEYPENAAALKKIASDISFYNAEKYFSF